MLDWRITSHHPLDKLVMSIRYCSADLYNTYTMYHLLDVCWHILNDTMSQYYLCYYWIFGLNGVDKKVDIVVVLEEFQVQLHGILTTLDIPQFVIHIFCILEGSIG